MRHKRHVSVQLPPLHAGEEVHVGRMVNVCVCQC